MPLHGLRNLNCEDLAYLAGIVDGEGSIVLWLDPKKRGGYHVCRISISNTDHGILNECKRILNSLGIFWCSFVVKKATETSKQVNVIEVNRRNEVLELIPLIKPFIHSEEKLEKCGELEKYLINHAFDKLGRKLNYKKKAGRMIRLEDEGA